MESRVRMFKLLLLLSLSVVIHVEGRNWKGGYSNRLSRGVIKRPTRQMDMYGYVKQPQSDWFHDMGDDWEVSNRLPSVNPYYSWYKQTTKQMDMFSPAKHVGKINRGQFFTPELNTPSDRALGFQSDFNRQDFGSGAFKYKPQGQKFRAKAVHVAQGLASSVGEILSMRLEDGTILRGDFSSRNGNGEVIPVYKNPCSVFTQPIYQFSGWQSKCSLDSNLVFDPRFYLATYSDLRCAFIKPGVNSFDAAAQHWCDHGAKEGRQGIESFSSKAYLEKNQYLRMALGNKNYAGAVAHFISTGDREGINGYPTSVLNPQVGSCSIHQGPVYQRDFSGWKPKCDSDSPHIFDPQFYLATNVDLRCAFIKPGIKSFDKAAQHWCNHGMKEGRKGIADFDTKKQENSCIQHKAPIYHFAARTPKCSLDSNLVFDPRFYLATYNDLRCAFIKPGIDSFTRASQHWCNSGAKEGRQGVQIFSSKAYLARYIDLQTAFGNDFAAATTHFIETGFSEGRSGKPDVATTTQVKPCSVYTQPIYHYSSWTPKCLQDSELVFDARFYLATYNDLRCAFIKPGTKTFDAAAQHWCSHGVREGRQGIASFNSKAYLARYVDLRNAFGDNNYVRATTHFIQHGFSENRFGN